MQWKLTLLERCAEITQAPMPHNGAINAISYWLTGRRDLTDLDLIRNFSINSVDLLLYDCLLLGSSI